MWSEVHPELRFHFGGAKIFFDTTDPHFPVINHYVLQFICTPQLISLEMIYGG